MCVSDVCVYECVVVVVVVVVVVGRHVHMCVEQLCVPLILIMVKCAAVWTPLQPRSAPLESLSVS